MKSSGIGFKPLPKLKDLDPGIEAYGFTVMVLPRELNDEIEMIGPLGETKKFRIEKTDGGDLKREEDAGSEGVLVSMGMTAGAERWPRKPDGSPDYERGHPRLGDCVLFSRYAGKHAEFTGADGRTYRMMKDEDVQGRRFKDAESAVPPKPASTTGRAA